MSAFRRVNSRRRRSPMDRYATATKTALNIWSARDQKHRCLQWHQQLLITITRLSLILHPWGVLIAMRCIKGTFRHKRFEFENAPAIFAWRSSARDNLPLQLSFALNIELCIANDNQMTSSRAAGKFRFALASQHDVCVKIECS